MIPYAPIAADAPLHEFDAAGKSLALALLLAATAAAAQPASGPDAAAATDLADALRRPWPPAAVAGPTRCQTAALKGSRRTIDVGPGREHADLTSVPWLSLGPGDVVNIYPREAPYATKFALRARGSADEPVIVNGVTDAKCQRPTITGAGAVTAADAVAERYFDTPGGEVVERLGTIVIFRGADDAYGHKPAHLRIQNLKITGASSSQRFVARNNKVLTYSKGAAGIYAVVADHLTVENCEITRNDNGVFVNTKNEGVAETSAFVTLRFNHLYNNGVPGSYYEHNVYLQGLRPLVEGNYIGQLVPGAQGSSLKDRGSGSVVRYNHIVAAARALDLVEAEGGIATMTSDPLYPHAWVYGNLIVDDWDNPGVSSSALIHWGGDNTPRNFRTGTLYFYQNTVLSRLAKNQFWHLTVFDLPGTQQRVEAWSNLFAHYRNAEYRLGNAGRIMLAGTNLLPRGWSAGGAEVQRGVRVLESADVKLNVDASLGDDSPALDRAGGADEPRFPAGVDAAALKPTFTYRHVGRIVPRQTLGAAPDLGALEYSSESIAIPFSPN